VSIDTWTIVPNALDAGLPEETCICFSQKAAYVSGINPQSQRGRVYIGPLASGALAGATAGQSNWTNPAEFKTSLMNLLIAAATDLAGHNAAAHTWVIFSPTLSQSFDVDYVFVDNAPDTQRRRGAKADLRIGQSV